MTGRRTVLVVGAAGRPDAAGGSIAGWVAGVAAAFGLQTVPVPAGDVPPAGDAPGGGDPLGGVAGAGVVAVFADGADAVAPAAALAARLGLPWPRAAASGHPEGPADGPVRVAVAVDGEVLALVDEVGDGGYDCPAGAGRRVAAGLTALAAGTLRDLGATAGPATVRIDGEGQAARVLAVLPGTVDARHATLVELVTGVDPVAAAVAAATTGATGGDAGALRRPGRHRQRYAALRATTGDGAAVRAAMAVPGTVAARGGPSGYVIALADRPEAARVAATLAAAAAAGTPPAAVPQTPRLRVACVRGDDHHHRYLETQLRRRHDVRLVVVEPEAEKVRAMRLRGRYRDWVYHLYHRYRRSWTGKDRYRARYFAHAPRLWQLRADTTMRVRSVNDDAVVAALRATEVDVVVIIGCSILARRTLEAAGPLVINVHGGFLPWYRGNHCFFFAVYDRRFDRVGSTIHRVDAGVDTGDLIEVVRPPLRGDELPEHLYCAADLLAIHRLTGWLDVIAAGGRLPSLRQPPVGRTYRTRDRGPSHDLRYFLRRCAQRLGAGPAGQRPAAPVEGAVP